MHTGMRTGGGAGSTVPPPLLLLLLLLPLSPYQSLLCCDCPPPLWLPAWIAQRVAFCTLQLQPKFAGSTYRSEGRAHSFGLPTNSWALLQAG